jgi:hypothetical protein
MTELFEGALAMANNESYYPQDLLRSPPTGYYSSVPDMGELHYHHSPFNESEHFFVPSPDAADGTGYVTSQNPNSTFYPFWEPGVTVNATDYRVLTKDELYLRLRPYQIALLSVAYALVFFLGVIGNLLVIAVVVRYPSMQSVTNVFIANLAIADLLVVVICLPVNLIQSIFVGECQNI